MEVARREQREQLAAVQSARQILQAGAMQSTIRTPLDEPLGLRGAQQGRDARALRLGRDTSTAAPRAGTLLERVAPLMHVASAAALGFVYGAGRGYLRGYWQAVSSRQRGAETPPFAPRTAERRAGGCPTHTQRRDAVAASWQDRLAPPLALRRPPPSPPQDVTPSVCRELSSAVGRRTAVGAALLVVAFEMLPRAKAEPDRGGHCAAGCTLPRRPPWPRMRVLPPPSCRHPAQSGPRRPSADAEERT